MSDAPDLQIDWRSLLDAIGVEWRDRGPNTSRGNVNISCPFCGDDPSFHMALSEEREAYYCYRQPRKHRGRDFQYLLHRMGLDRVRVRELLNAYRGASPERRQKKPKLENAAVVKAWGRFRPLTESPAHMAYLAGRGIPADRATREFDLRYAPEGEWAARVLFPINDDDGQLASWTGRDITGRLPLRYLTPGVEADGLLYAPRLPLGRLVLVEGPFDTLPINIAMAGSGTAAAGLLGLGVNPDKLLRIRHLARFCKQLLIAIDASANPNDAHTLRAELAALLPGCYIKRIRLPPGIDDPGAMPIPLVAPWLRDTSP